MLDRKERLGCGTGIIPGPLETPPPRALDPTEDRDPANLNWPRLPPLPAPLPLPLDVQPPLPLALKYRHTCLYTYKLSKDF